MSAIDFSDPSTIAALTDALTTAGLDGLEISRPGGNLRIVVSKESGAQVSLTGDAQPGFAAIPAATVKAPMAGQFYALHPSDSEGGECLPRTVADQDVIGFIRIGSVLLPIPAGRSGLLTKQLVEPDALVGFGDPLFEIEPIS
ncbi:acetyl-CoA carboxylase (plasmid) [Rhizobium sp. CB3090]|uniref:acetyl-CoA carboxylase biotin carboxyl carrier protein n=1 Tax=Rhizobium sp. CB3090 TaxID=3039156 RepID=UPI0024B08613|nr:acetyl-CoA carboxylase [Rhizobium sp. CB3090]WFU12227.1 acetyl-CoA carboxylase [Rhizobium sp. CB3090]